MVEKEYIGLDQSQTNFAKKNLLESQAELLETIKRYEKYKKFRKQELSLKNLLKKVVVDLQEEVKTFDKFMPHIHQEKREVPKIPQSQKKRRDLDMEIEEIRRKIAALSAE